jgi:hypothetical protein
MLPRIEYELIRTDSADSISIPEAFAMLRQARAPGRAISQNGSQNS